MRLLIDAGADKSIANKYGKKPIDRVCGGTLDESRKDAIVALLSR